MEQELRKQLGEVIKYLEEIKTICYRIDNVLDYNHWEDTHSMIKYTSHNDEKPYWDNEYDFVFQIVNNGHIGLPDTIKRLQFYHIDEDVCKILHLPIEKYVPPTKLNNKNGVLDFTKVFSLPDHYEIEANHPIINDFCIRLETYFKTNSSEVFFPFKTYFNDNDSIGDYEIYDNLKRGIIKDERLYGFIGGYIRGYINRPYTPPILPKQGKYDFLMQFDPGWENGDIIYIFYNPENTKEPFYSEIIH